MSENLNLLTSLSFKFEIDKFPNITYFCQSCSIPGIQIGEAQQASPFVDFSVPGDTLTFDTLSAAVLTPALVTKDTSSPFSNEDTEFACA